MTMLYRARLLSSAGPDRLEEHPDGGLLVEGGRIAAVGPFEALRAQHPGAGLQDLRPLWILPGLVDAHTHIPQLGAVAEDGLELLPWLERYIFPAEAAFADTKHAARMAKAFFAEALSWGTTTVAAYGTVHAEAVDAAFQAAERCGIRALIGQVLMDRNGPP
ncbi:MAG TPA: amidohydrolase family protein, partial [Holophagaceae bacterium]|nr:amidohydrolase family protein [Holophagaceae bacterium]